MFRADDRAVSEQVGMILMFGFLVVSMATYQATVVPQANQQVEFKHSQAVQADLMELHAALDRVAATDTPDTVSVALGTQYPQRTFFVNPPNPSGRLSTTDVRYVGLVNAEADGEAGDFWQAANAGEVGDVVDGERPPEAAQETEGWWMHTHRGIEYVPNYQTTTGDQYTVVDPPGFYSEFDGNVVQRSSRSPVDGRQIRLLLVNGSLSTASSNTENVELRPVSADTRTVTVAGGNDDPIVLHYPTELPKSEWRAVLGPERDPDQRNVDYWNYRTYDGQNYLYLALREENADGERIRYDLSLTKIGVGRDVEAEPAAYAVDVAGDGASVPEDGTQRVVVEVRDAYNGPTSGVDVSVQSAPERGAVYDPSSGEPSDRTVTTGEDGRAVFTYEPDDVSTTTPDEFELGFAAADDIATADDARTVTYDVEVRDVRSANYAVRWDLDAIGSQSGVDCAPAADRCTVDRAEAGDSIDATVATEPATAGVLADVSSRNPSVVSFGSRSEGDTGADGTLDRELRIGDSGTGEIFVDSFGGSDELAVDVVDHIYYRYYEGDYGTSEMPDFDAQRPVATGYTSAFDLSPRERGDEFGLSYTATLTVPKAGEYTFYTESDDGSRLWIDGSLVVDNGGDHSMGEEQGTVNLAEGRHEIRVDYYENSGDEGLRVSWSGPGFDKRQITPGKLDGRKPSEKKSS